MTIGRLIRRLFTKPRKIKIRTFDPERLSSKLIDNAYSKQYQNLRHSKKEYSWDEIKKLGMRDRRGNKVRVWRLIKSAYDINDDLYIAFYYKRKSNSRYS